MIPDQEIRRVARRLGMEPRLVDLDYTLGWALWGLRQNSELRQRLVFKGGTCLRKCWFPGYRFSEDLDFTATEWFPWKSLEEAVFEAFDTAGRTTGIDFKAEEPRSDIVEDDYGKEGLRIRIYYLGAHPRPNPRAIQLDITRHEQIVFESETREVHHDYSDVDRVGDWTWRCYSLEEVLAEKLRAVLGQRTYAISRDLYDIFRLTNEGLDLDAVKMAFPKKLSARQIAPEVVSVEHMLARRDDFRDDWDRNLVPLVPEAESLEFEEVWKRTSDFIRRFVAVEPTPR